MGHALNPDSEDRGDADLSHWIQASALQMDNIAEFQPLAGEALKRLRAAGLDFYALSIYLFDSPTTALHYAFAKGEVSWLQLDVTEEMAECKVYTDKEAHSWQTTQSDRDRVVAYLSVPTTTGVATIAAERVDLFAPVDRVLFAEMALALETLVVRHRDMVGYQAVNEAYLQVRSRLITGNPDLMALHDGSFDLSGETAEEVARRILEFIVQHLELDRGGIFLREDAELRGFWGMDEKGQPEQISQTVFPLYPERDEELTHTALIARGEGQ